MKTRVGMVAMLCAALLFQTATVFALDGGANHVEEENSIKEEDRGVKYNAIGKWSFEYDSTCEDFVYTYVNRPAGLQFSIPNEWKIYRINVNTAGITDVAFVEDFVLGNPNTGESITLESFESPDTWFENESYFEEWMEDLERENGYNIIDSYTTNEFTPDGGEWHVIKCVMQDESEITTFSEIYSRWTDDLLYVLSCVYFEGIRDGISSIFDSLQEIGFGYFSPVGYGASDGFWLFDQYYDEKLGISFTIPDGWELEAVNEVCPEHDDESTDELYIKLISRDESEYKYKYEEGVMDHLSEYAVLNFCLLADSPINKLELYRIDLNIAGQESLSDQELVDYYMEDVEKNLEDITETDWNRTIAGREYLGKKLEFDYGRARIYLFQRLEDQLYLFTGETYSDDLSSYEQFFDSVNEYTLTDEDMAAEIEKALDKVFMQTNEDPLEQSSEDDYTDEDMENMQEPDGYAEDQYDSYDMLINECLSKYGENSQYALYDLDKDGVQELFLSYGTCTADWQNDVYTISDVGAEQVGMFYNPVLLYEAEDGNGIYAVYGLQGYERINRITMVNGSIQEECITEGEVGNGEYYSNNYPIEWQWQYVYEDEGWNEYEEDNGLNGLNASWANCNTNVITSTHDHETPIIEDDTGYYDEIVLGAWYDDNGMPIAEGLPEDLSFDIYGTADRDLTQLHFVDNNFCSIDEIKRSRPIADYNNIFSNYNAPCYAFVLTDIQKNTNWYGQEYFIGYDYFTDEAIVVTGSFNGILNGDNLMVIGFFEGLASDDTINIAGRHVEIINNRF